MVVRPDMSNVPPELVMKRALPPVLASKNEMLPPLFVVMVALPAVVAELKETVPLLSIVAFPAVAVSMMIG